MNNRISKQATIIAACCAVVLTALLVPATAHAQGEVMYVINDKVGIGTALPKARLDVSGGDAIFSGNVGIGTDSPLERLHVVHSTGNAILRFDSVASANFILNRGNLASLSRFQFRTKDVLRWTLGMNNDGTDDFHLGPNTSTSYFYVNRLNGRVGIGTKTPAYPLQMASGAYVTVGGAWTDGSSRSYKEDIEGLDEPTAREAVMALEPVRFVYKNTGGERHVGFIAEDVPDLVASPDRKGVAPMDVVAILTKVVQEQQRTIEQLRARVEALEAAK